MVSINIAIKTEAYNFLKDLKAKDKSFSDVILSFKKEQNGIMRFFGVMKGLDWSDKEDRMGKLRESFNKKLLKYNNFVLTRIYSIATLVPMLCPGIPVSNLILKAPELP